MNTKPEETQPHQPSPPSTTPSPPKPEETQPHQPSPPSTAPPPPKPEETQPHQPSLPSTAPSPPKPEETQPHQPSPSSTTTPPPAPPSEKWGTHIMGQPAAPSSHPNNQKAALWRASDEGDEEEHHQPQQQHPYVQHSPIDKSSSNPMEPVIHVFNSWSHKAETLARNIWQNLKTGPSLSEAVYGKVGLTTKVLTGGGFEYLYKQTFVSDPNEKLKKTFACYMSTSTGPVAGTLYLSNIHVAFCSDRPLSFTAPSGQVSWSYYKVMIPLAKMSSINPVSMKENQAEKYIQITSTDNHDFWFMGFVNYDKASLHLSQSFSAHPTTGSV